NGEDPPTAGAKGSDGGPCPACPGSAGRGSGSAWAAGGRGDSRVISFGSWGRVPLGGEEELPLPVVGPWPRAGKPASVAKRPRNSASHPAKFMRTIVVLPFCGSCLVPPHFQVSAGQEPRESLRIVSGREMLKCNHSGRS